MMADQLESKHFLVSGVVQGVGFRRFVEREALTLGLSGWVRNREDGRVEAVACGSVDAMKQFLIKLHEGPQFSKVDKVEVKEAHEEVHHSRPHFVIR